MAKFKRSFEFEPIDKSSVVHVKGCSNFSFFNAGNVNMTINKVLVLVPGASWPNLNDNPDIEDSASFNIEFNIGDGLPPPSFEAPVPGFGARDGSGTNPTGAFDTRAILIKTILT